MSFLMEEILLIDLEEEIEKQFDEGNYDKALTNFKLLLKIQKRTFGRTHEYTLHTQSRIAAVLEKQMKYDKALEILIKLYETKLRTFGILNDSTGKTRCCVVELIKKHGFTILTQKIVRLCMSAIRLEVRTIKDSYLRGRYVEALKSTLAIWRNMRTFIREDNSVVGSLAVLVGKIYTAREEYDKAIIVFSEIHQKIEGIFDKKDRRTATALMRKASVLHKMCKFKEALELYLKAHNIRRDILGLFNKNTLLSLLKIAKLQSDIGKHDQALKSMNIVYERQERKRNKASLLTNINIGLLHMERRDYEKALEVFQDKCQVKGVSKRRKAMIKTKIGNLLTRLGRYIDARRVLMKTIKMRKSSDHHMDTLLAYRELATTLAKEGMVATTFELLNVLMEASNRVLGFRHSVTLTIQSDLALYHFALSHYEEALNMFTNIWRIRDKVLGSFHPDTLHAKYEVARVYRRQGQTDMALKLYNQVWTVQKAIFYIQNARCLTVESEIAETYLSIGSYSLAFQIIYEVYEKKVKMYGKKHPYTFAMMEDVARFGRNLPMPRLITAALFEDLEKVKKCLEQGDDVNERDSSGGVALHYASREGCVDMLKYLLSKGAIYDIKDIVEKKPENYAYDTATREVFVLVKRLFRNVKRCNQDEVRRILEQENSIVNARDKSQRTPLQWAVGKRHQGIVKDLIDHGADPLLGNQDDGTVLHKAARNGDNEIMSFLLNHVSLNNPEKFREFVSNKNNYLGLAPLHIAVMESFAECFYLLLEYNVNPLVLDAFGRMAIDLAINENIRVDIAYYSNVFLNSVKSS